MASALQSLLFDEASQNAALNDAVSYGRQVDRQALKSEIAGDLKDTVLGKMLFSALGGAALPKDAWDGKVDPTSIGGIERAADLAGILGLSSFPLGSRAAKQAANEGKVLLGTFAGPRAKTADQSALKAAKELAEAGVLGGARKGGRNIVQRVTDDLPAFAPRHLPPHQREAWQLIPEHADRLKATLEQQLGVPVALSKSDSGFGRSWYLRPEIEVYNEPPFVVRLSDHDATSRAHQVEARINMSKFAKDDQGNWSHRLSTPDEINEQIQSALEFARIYAERNGLK